MTREEECFLSILKNHINKEETHIVEIDWVQLLRIAQSQQMSAIISYQCKSCMRIADGCLLYYAAISQYTARQKIIDSIKEKICR